MNNQNYLKRSEMIINKKERIAIWSLSSVQAAIVVWRKRRKSAEETEGSLKLEMPVLS